MKYLIKFIVLLVTWPLLLIALLFVGFLWLVSYCWGDDKSDLEPIIKHMAYGLWHFKVKSDE